MFNFVGIIDINASQLYCDNWTFGISLQSGSVFYFVDCIYKFTRGNEGHIEEKLEIFFNCDTNDINMATEKICNSIKMLTFFLSFPLDAEDIYIRPYNGQLPSTNQKSVKKTRKLKSFSDKIERFNTTRMDFENIISLYYLGIKFLYLIKFKEETFISFFKVVECVTNFDIDNSRKNYKNYLKNNTTSLNSFVDVYTFKNFNLRYPASKKKDLSNKIYNLLSNFALDDNYSRIYLFCKTHNIYTDPEKLFSAVKTRNRISHGKITDDESIYSDINFIIPLARKVIITRFFGSNALKEDILIGKVEYY